MASTATAIAGVGILEPRSLDHFVVLVRDANRAAESYERLGFHVRPLAEHEEIGSRNRVVHFDQTYLEFIDLSDSRREISAPYLDRFELGEGLVHVSLTSEDLEADREQLREAGFEPAPIISARRKITLPDGRGDETASSCFYLWREKNRYLSLFFSAHPKPHTIFIPEYVSHANTAREVSRCVYVSRELDDDAEHFTTCFGAEPEVRSADHLCWRGTRGDLTEVLNPTAARGRYGDLLEAGTPGRFPGMGVALHYRVDDLEQCRRTLEQGGADYRAFGEGGVAVPAASAVGCAMVFEA